LGRFQVFAAVNAGRYSAEPESYGTRDQGDVRATSQDDARCDRTDTNSDPGVSRNLADGVPPVVLLGG
jgi:hypothetical protein